MTLPISGSKPGSQFQDGPAFSVRGTTTTQIVPSVTLTKVILQAEDFDTGNAFDSTTNYRFQPSVAGYYFFTGVVRATANANSMTVWFAELWKNGVAEIRGIENNQTASNAGSTQAPVSGLIYLNGTTDYVELFGYIAGTSPAFQNATANKAGSCFLQGFLARAA